VIVPLSLRLVHHPGLLQQVGVHGGPLEVHHAHLVPEQQLGELAEAGAIVIPGRLGIAKGLHDRRRCQHLALDLRLGLRTSDGGEVPHGVFGGHRLARSRLPADDDAQVAVFALQFRVRLLREGKDVGLQIAHGMTPVGPDDARSGMVTQRLPSLDLPKNKLSKVLVDC